MTGRFPLTDFICAMLPLPVDKLARADTDKLAAKYAISPAHAAGFIHLRVGRK